MALYDRHGGGGRTERWVKHYSSFHRILLVGEGDFSFALSLAVSFGSASNIVATSYDSYDTVINKYKRGFWNLSQLHMFGATLYFGVDATQMRFSGSDLANLKFDRVVYNFPHAGFLGKEDDPNVIRRHRDLVNGFFHNAGQMLRPHGEIHVSHKISPPFCNWRIEAIAFRNSLHMLQCAPFNINNYPGYENKRGDGIKADDPFPLGECCTYKFGHRYNLRSNNLTNHGCIRFSVCGVSMGEPGIAGCGGVMTDEERRVCLMFWEPLGRETFEAAELCAFEVALFRLMRSGLLQNRFVVFGSGSREVVSWIKYPSTRPVRPMSLAEHFVRIDGLLGLASGVRIEVVSRAENGWAEDLARKAVVTGEPFDTGYVDC